MTITAVHAEPIFGKIKPELAIVSSLGEHVEFPTAVWPRDPLPMTHDRLSVHGAEHILHDSEPAFVIADGPRAKIVEKIGSRIVPLETLPGRVIELSIGDR